ncbi:Hemerythrin HHE cation binding domain protein [Parafrankia sp. EAN1pec]|uniref:hemerythrin domain-containing protein n=1 Tax=Parafrankia sp. (strain EAN1pec) TaxID=298653 RepID=UPI000054452B|nr:Hemerythrin HHE cation binding domain protein [Frankia sp. EAN1pec]
MARALIMDDLAGFVIAHAGMRREFGRLARVARAPRGAEHAALIEEQIALTTDVLHSHHAGEDRDLWPLLRLRAPEAAGELDALAAEHESVDPLLAAAAETAVALTERAQVLEALHDLINAHLDHEDTVVLPLMLDHLTLAEMEEIGRQALAEIGRRRAPAVFGWYSSGAHKELRTAALATVPPIPRFLFNRFWWPSYQRRFELLYGADEHALLSV